MKTSEPIRIAVIEDQTILRETLVRFLSQEDNIQVVGDFPDAESAMTFFQTSHCDIAIIDRLLPGMDGIAFIKKLKGFNSGVKTIVLSVLSREENIMEAFEAGVMGYLSKESYMKELVDAIRTVNRGEAVLSPKICKRFVEYCAKRKEEPCEKPALTETEVELLKMACEGHSNKEIAAALRTTTAHVKNSFHRLFRRIDARDRTHAVIKAVRMGLIKVEEEQ